MRNSEDFLVFTRRKDAKAQDPVLFLMGEFPLYSFTHFDNPLRGPELLPCGSDDANNLHAAQFRILNMEGEFSPFRQRKLYRPSDFRTGDINLSFLSGGNHGTNSRKN